jgi:hypothetical protein
MHLNVRARLTIAAGMVALGLAATACNKSSNQSTADTRGTSGSADNAPAITLTGCLQEGKGIGSSYILTQANRASEPVGTSGSAAAGDKVRSEELKAAVKSYRLDGDNGQLRDLLGKQVRVSGRVTDQGDLNKDRDRVASGKSDLDESDLARVKVDSMDKVADACSGRPY